MNGTKDFAFAQELSIEDRTKKETHCVLLKQHECSVSRGFPLGDGCRYTDAALFNDAINTELPRDQKTRSTQRTKRPRDLLGNHQKKQPPKNMWVWAREGNEMTGRSSSEVALRTPPNDNEAPPEKRRNGGGDVFSGGCARRACGVAAAGRWHGGES